MTIAIICTALLGLLIFALGMAVSFTRQGTQTVIGYDPSPTDRLHKVVRAHGNSTEYAPMLAILFMALGATSPAAWVGWVMMAAVASRYLIVAGLLTGALDQANPLRFIGALGTYASGIILSLSMFRAL